MSKLDKMTVSKSLKKLVRMDLVARHENQEDTRAKSVQLTKSGVVLASKLVPIVEGVDEDFFTDCIVTVIYLHLNWYKKRLMQSNVAQRQELIYHEFYRTRFQIEGVFKDLKSSGFQLERSKIKKYDRFKRLVALCMTAHVILVMTGQFIREKATPFLKSYPLHGGIMLACFPLENSLFQCLTTNA